ncbi:MAG: hypothetical protein IKL68_02995 [Clostridia bacterium]|nr:hypothetical protein [Clostridia bacterium]
MKKANINYAEMYEKIENSIVNMNQGMIFKSLVGGDSEYPKTVLRFRDYTFGQVVSLMISLEDTLKYLIKEYPEAYAIALDADVEVTKRVE